MIAGIIDLLRSRGLSPHGFCLLWAPGLIRLHVIADAAIGVSYFLIPVALAYLVQRHKDLAFGWIFWMFAAFILACGTTHFFEIWTIWHPDYGLQGLLKALTACVSLLTAVMIWRLMPQLLAVPTPIQYRRLEAIVTERTAKLAELNRALRRQIEERRQAEAQLIQARKMEAVGQLTGGIAHDFNNLLQVIQINLDLAAQLKGGNPDRLSRALGDASDATARAARLTKSLLAYSRQQPLEPEVISANTVVASISEILRRTIGVSVQVETKMEKDLWLANLDPSQLENAILNLALNARDAMSAGGMLSIETSNTELGQAKRNAGIEIPPGQYVRLTVKDTGHGMSAEVMDKAFDPFFTTKPLGQGTGLGLSQVYGFIKQSDGHILIESSPGAGTAINIYLPRHGVE